MNDVKYDSHLIILQRDFASNAGKLEAIPAWAKMHFSQKSEIIVPNVRCCPAAPELIMRIFRDVRSHYVELKDVRWTPAE